MARDLEGSSVKTILLVDDEYSIIEVLAYLLEEEGFAVLTASNGRAARSPSPAPRRVR